MPKKILLAEDSVTMQRAVQITFAAEDYIVTVASTVNEALELANTNSFDVVIADLSMDGKNGYDLCRELKSNGKNVPVLLLHGSTAPYDSDKALEVGADGEIRKPFETQDLIEKVKGLAAEVVKETAKVPFGKVEALAPPISSLEVPIEGIGKAEEKKPVSLPPLPPPIPQQVEISAHESPVEVVIEAELPPSVGVGFLPSFEMPRGKRDLPPPPPGMPLPTVGAVGMSGISEDAIKQAVASISKEVIERVVREVVPELAERIIRQELDRLVEKRS